MKSSTRRLIVLTSVACAVATVAVWADVTVSSTTAPAGDAWEVVDTGVITTSGSVVIQPNADVVFWSQTKVHLLPGFHALPATGTTGRTFWAAIDSNMNGYSDMEELVDTNHNGIPDAWELDHGLSLANNNSAYLADYQAGLDPRNSAVGKPMPTTTPQVQLVLRTSSGSFIGVNTGTWEIGTYAGI